MTPFAIPKIATVLGGGAILAQVDIASTYKEYGITVILILAVAGLWLAGEKKEKATSDLKEKHRAEQKVEDREIRAERETNDDRRMDKFVSAIGKVDDSIKASDQKCAFNQDMFRRLNDRLDDK